MRIVTVLGTRPQLIKEAALQPVLRLRHDEFVIDTGQHYDDALAGAFFGELGLAPPDLSLGLGGGGHSDQTGRMLIALEPILVERRPDIVLVIGDTNSTLAGALAAVKLKVPVAHVEAGLRAHDLGIPEEVNRLVADHLSHWLFAPTPTAVGNLGREGIAEGVHLVGDLMRDLAAQIAPAVCDPGPALHAAGRALAQAGAADVAGMLRPGGYLFATIHRASNREREAMLAWATILTTASRERPLILALHPGTRAALADEGVTLGPNVHVVEPLGYRTSLTLQLHAAAVLTDSGGVQRESAWLGTPCLLLRPNTEWVEALEGAGGTIVCVGLDVDRVSVELARLAPVGGSEALAAERARSLDLAPDGAAEAIGTVLA
jgi:UDP-GlcNAc3NAcA epimerase